MFKNIAFWRFEYEHFFIFLDEITQLIPQDSVILSEIENDIREHHKTHYSVIHVHVSTTTRLRGLECSNRKEYFWSSSELLGNCDAVF